MKKIKLSIFGPPATILVDNEDDMKVIIECPNCGLPTRYGNTRMVSGFSGCDNIITVDGKEVECYFGDLLPRVMDAHENNYELYREGKFYRKDWK